MSETVRYTLGEAKLKDVSDHLMACSASFIPPLSSTVDIPTYAKKIHANAVLFEAWVNDVLVGLIAAYFNNLQTKIGFITNVSLVPGFTGKGIAKELLKQTLQYGKNIGFAEVQLEVNKNNAAAIALYKKMGFKQTGENGNNLAFHTLLPNE